MLLENVVALLLIIVVATYVQTTTGFGFGVLVVAASTAFNATSILFSAAIVSFASMLNIGFSLSGEWRHVDQRNLILLTVGTARFGLALCFDRGNLCERQAGRSDARKATAKLCGQFLYQR